MMITIYIDTAYCCHLTNDGTMRAIETDFFDEKCSAYIEGFRFVPEGETWVREDGTTFVGEMITPFVDYSQLLKAQEQYELDQVAAEDMRQALEILGVTDE